MTRSFWQRGIAIVEGFLSPEECAQVLHCIDRYRSSHELPLIHRPAPVRSLHYRVIDGDRIGAAIPDLPELRLKVDRELDRICQRPLELIEDRTAAINVNITPPGGEYRWHYDRNAVTALIYFNEVPGGETEVYPNYRLGLGFPRHSRPQQALDWLLRLRPIMRVFGRPAVVAPRTGSLLVMRGNRSLHSVRRVEGDQDRLNIVLAYDVPGASRARVHLNRYLYSAQASADSDPNYGR